jgi:hypothetical protein
MCPKTEHIMTICHLAGRVFYFGYAFSMLKNIWVGINGDLGIWGKDWG